MWLSLGTVLVPVLVIIYFAGPGAPAVMSTNYSDATRVEPGTQSVMDYLRAHSSIPDSALVPNPEAQSVADYLRAHGTDVSLRAQSVPEPAVQSVMDYLRAHGSTPAQDIPRDPAAQSVQDYLHAHGQ
jgi:hypothetical protein